VRSGGGSRRRAGWLRAGNEMRSARGASFAGRRGLRTSPTSMSTSLVGDAKPHGRNAHASKRQRGQDEEDGPVGMPSSLLPRPKPFWTAPRRRSGYGRSGSSGPTIDGRSDRETGAVGAGCGADDGMPDMLRRAREGRTGCWRGVGEVKVVVVKGGSGRLPRARRTTKAPPDSQAGLETPRRCPPCICQPAPATRERRPQGWDVKR
jgi:hypothetical protein